MQLFHRFLFRGFPVKFMRLLLTGNLDDDGNAELSPLLLALKALDRVLSLNPANGCPCTLNPQHRTLDFKH